MTDLDLARLMPQAHARAVALKELNRCIRLFKAMPSAHHYGLLTRAMLAHQSAQFEV